MPKDCMPEYFLEKDSPPADAAPEDEEVRLEAELHELTRCKQESEQRVRDLRESEDPKAGIFYADEIFTEQQRKLTLETEMEFARKRLARLRMAL